MNVQFAGFLTSEEQPRMTPFLKRPKKKKNNSPCPFISMNSLFYSIWGRLNNSCVAETPRALPIGAVVLHLRSFSHVW